MRISTTDPVSSSGTETGAANTASKHRRRSSAHVSGSVEGGALGLWSHGLSTVNPKPSSRERRKSSFSRRLSVGGLSSGPAPSTAAPAPAPLANALNVSTRRESSSPRQSPTLSPRKRASTSSSPSTRFRSAPPIFESNAIPTLPRLTYEPVSTSTARTAASGITPLVLPSTGTDYFASKPTAGHHSPKRSPRPDVTAGAYSPSRASNVVETKKPSVGVSRHGESDAQHGTLSDSDNSESAQQRDSREQDKKTMLSRALQKAHTAVLLDNAQNYEGAVEAYGEACSLLHQVLVRSSGEEDRKKLDAIRTTYTNRVQELLQLNIESQQASGKSLPARPMSNDSITPGGPVPLSLEPPEEDEEDEAVIIETATLTPIGGPKLSPRLTASKHADLGIKSRPPKDSMNLRPPGTQLNPPERFLTIESPMDVNYIPPPLSPRRKPDEQLLQPDTNNAQQHSRGNSGSGGSVSWLDTIDESGGSSCDSSVHSLTHGGLYRKHLGVTSGDTEAEFDAALDAAVEAAYDDGLEPYDYTPPRPAEELPAKSHKMTISTDSAKLSAREEVIQAAHKRSRQLHSESTGGSRDLAFGDDDDEEEEERMLEEMTKEYVEGFDFGLQSKSALPRQSDSSGYSGTTWHSSVSSTRNTALTALSTVTEKSDASTAKADGHNLPRLSEEGGQRDVAALTEVTTSPQRKAPPPPPTTAPPAQPGSVRSRRMSGQNAKQLKIETAINPATRKPLPQTAHPAVGTGTLAALSRPEPAHSKSATSAASLRPDGQTLPDSVFKPPGSATFAAPQSYMPQSGSPLPSASPAAPMAPSPATPGPLTSSSAPLKKNKSSISLKNKALSVSSPDGSEASVGTPMSTTFSAFPSQSRRPPPLAGPTPSVPTFGDSVPLTNVQSNNLNLFESDLHSPYVPGSPNPMAVNAPIPLEPCPDSHLLRPYWLMRCFYQTIAHPRGGYLSTKLFVPRDVWRVKGVKIKGVDDKIANLDLLTAALQKLGSVDTLDADAVLEEIQSLEQVLDQVQNNLVKKIGSEVGVQGISSLFKDAPTSSTGENAGQGGSSEPSSNSARTVSQGKSYLTSWRKLRSKNSAVNLTTYSSKDQNKDSLVLSTLPMTSLPNPRFARRNVAQLELSGPHAAYMGSLARLFDAVQVIDQIARQVEDPGLKHSSPTHVGMELSTRHASEFFGFYVCRFVLADLTMLLDKFIKRGSEWVLV